MKKILFVINQFYKGGAETSLLNLLKKLDKSKYDIDLIIMNQCPVENAVSLVEQLPKEIHIFDAWKELGKRRAIQHIQERCLLTHTDKETMPISALLYVRQKNYDWAFHVGEWWSPQFVAEKVNAKHKCLWIHSDLSKAEYFQADHYFSFDSLIEYYIFVCENSKDSSLKAYPFIKEKSICIYNINDIQLIKNRADEPVEEDYFSRGLPVVVTCANVRAEKNHERQLAAMEILKKRGVEFIWLNLGATTEVDRCIRIEARAAQAGLKNHFIFAGPRENPYKYMKVADIVAVLSDYESWSMVITEAKILHKPIISTKTSGALEQICDGVNGMMTEFDAVDIANKLEMLLKERQLRETFAKNLEGIDNTQEIIQKFDALIDEEFKHEDSRPQDLLYVIDDINYVGGAHIATKLQIKEFLKRNKKIAIFSSNDPSADIRNELSGVQFVSWRNFPEDNLYHRRIADCLLDTGLTKEQKRYKIKLTFEGKIKNNPKIFDEMVFLHLSKLFSKYNTVCVMSEGSCFRKAVAASSCKRKVQWIHIDYAEWKNQTDWNRQITADDGELYKAFDRIVVLTESIKRRFVNLYPHLENKVIVNANILPVDQIRAKAVQKTRNERILRFVTVGRIDYQKAYPRLLDVLEALYDQGYRFDWTIVGGGDDFNSVFARINNSCLKDSVRMLGMQKNPYPYIKEADVFALLSMYEGLPNTLFEALILGTPVIATNVGGVADIVVPGENGWLTENNESSIEKMLKFIIENTEAVDQMKAKIQTYSYDNKAIIRTAQEVLFGE